MVTRKKLSYRKHYRMKMDTCTLTNVLSAYKCINVCTVLDSTVCKLCSVHALKSNLNYAQTQHIKVANLCKGPVNSSVLKTGRKDSVLLENGALQLGMSSQYNVWHIKLDCLALLRHVSPTNHQALTVYTTARPHIYI